jgi:hypothetical protein
MKHLGTLGLLALLGLSSCDLSEAERMDLSRSGVGAIACANPEVQFAGGDSIPLTVLLQATPYQGLANHFELVWKDQGTVKDWSGAMEARLGTMQLFGFSFDGIHSNENVYETPWYETNWQDSLDSIKFTLLGNPCNDSSITLNLHVYDDRPSLSIRIRNDLTSVRNGDTLRVDLTNRSASEVLNIASDYRGLRLLGDYLVSMKPGETKTMEWIVVASSGLSGWLDLSWGSYGQSKHIVFQTR